MTLGERDDDDDDDVFLVKIGFLAKDHLTVLVLSLYRNFFFLFFCVFYVTDIGGFLWRLKQAEVG